MGGQNRTTSDNDDPADSDYEINWYLPNSVLDRVVSTKDRNENRIEIEDLRTGDSGTYRCTAQRLAGSAKDVVGAFGGDLEDEEDLEKKPANLVQKVVLKVKGGEESENAFFLPGLGFNGLSLQLRQAAPVDQPSSSAQHPSTVSGIVSSATESRTVLTRQMKVWSNADTTPATRS